MAKLTGLCETCGKAMEFYPSQAKRYCSQTCMGIAKQGRPRAPRAAQPINKVTSVCPVCGTGFEHWPGEKRTTCSRECLYKYLQARRQSTRTERAPVSNKVTTLCAVCGEPFTAWPSQKRLVCSTACSGIYRGRARLGVKRAPILAARTGQVLACETCGKDFYAPRTQVADGRRYCSTACRGVADRKPRTIKPCAYCGKEMSLKPSAVANGRAYCSHECRALGQTKSWTLLGRTYNGRPVKRDRKGYIWVWAPERANRAHPGFGGWYQEHRLVVEAALGRELRSDEDVHHVNGQPGDNRLENLQVLGYEAHLKLTSHEQQAQRARERAELLALRGVLAELAEYRRLYGPLLPAADDETISSGGSTSSAAAR